MVDNQWKKYRNTSKVIAVLFILILILVCAATAWTTAVSDTPNPPPSLSPSPSHIAYKDASDNQIDDSALLTNLLARHDHVVIPSGVTLKIAGVDVGSGKRISGPGTISKLDSAPYALHIVGKDVAIDGLRFKPQKVFGQPNCDIKLGDGSGDISILQNHFEGGTGPYSAICAAEDTEAAGGTEYEQHAKGILITGNIFIGYVRPLYFHSVDNVTVQGNIIRNTIRDAIRLRENDGYVIIDGNQFFDIGRDDNKTQTQDAIDSCWSGHKLVITNNIVRRTASVGFDIKGQQTYSGQGSSSVIIANNHISETAYSGIVLAGNYQGKPIHTVVVQGNILENNSRVGKIGHAALWVKGSARHITIANNQVAFNRNQGISVRTHKGTFDHSVVDVLITGNSVFNNGIKDEQKSIGIHVLGVDGLILSNNIVSNDPALDNAEQRIGLFVAPSKTVRNAIVRDNIVRGHDTQTILESGGLETENSQTEFFIEDES